MSEWKEYKLGEMIFTNVQSISKAYPYSNIKYLDTGSITCNQVDSLQEFKLEDAPSRAKRLVCEDDIIYSTVRPNQLHYGYINNPLANLVVSTGFVIITCNKDIINPKYLYYNLTQKQTTEYLHSIAEASTSTYPSLKPSDIEALDILLPSIEEQKQISGILSSLDAKIDLLNRQNSTLEAMAETLFRQYFIENPKPEWEEISLFQCINLVGGGTPKTSIESYWIGDINWLSGGDIANNHKGYVTESVKQISLNGLNNSSAKLLPANATVISSRGTVGKYCLLSKPMAFSQSNYGILPGFKDCYFFTYLLIAFSVNELQTAAYGSVFDTITTDTFKGLSMLLPKEETIFNFEKLISVYFERIRLNSIQICTLTKLRDTLLPKLMNNEIKVNITK